MRVKWVEIKGQLGQGERSVGSRWKVMCVNWLVILAGGGGSSQHQVAFFSYLVTLTFDPDLQS